MTLYTFDETDIENNKNFGDYLVEVDEKADKITKEFNKAVKIMEKGLFG